MKRAATVLLSAVALAGSAAFVSAKPMWSAMGHYMTAAIAQGYLSPAAQNGCNNLLPSVDGDIGLVASWADEVARDEYPWSPQLHFINTPDWSCDYSQTRDCFGSYDNAPLACVDGAIQNYTAQLAAGDQNYNLTEALMFLVHFIGDIHQPLHVGFTGDEGGNTISGTYEGQDGIKLHHVWDYNMIEQRIANSFGGDNSTYLQYFMQQLQSGIYTANITNWKRCSNATEPNQACSSEWANGSVRLACSTAYTDQNGNQIQNGFDLEDPYYNFAIPVVEMQLAKGGIRLAHVLNSIFASKNLAKYTVPREEYLRNEAKERAAKVGGIALE